MSLYFVSDIHIKSNNERNAFLFMQLLRQLREKQKTEQVELILLGDIFDLWLSKHDVFIARHEPLIQELSRAKQAGVQIHFFEGNHDVHIDVFFQNQLGLNVYDKFHVFNWYGLRVRCEHGDYINPDDVVYHRYLKIIRNDQIEKIGHIVPGFFWDISGRIASRISRQSPKKKIFAKNHKMRDLVLQYSQNIFKKEPFDILVTGHVHYRMNEVVDQKFRTINLGSWFEEPQVLNIHQDKQNNVATSWLRYENGIFQAL
jgi:UDP-2,3-diacylglucosamine hydrolase